ncbi:hypothetical protein Ct9H90mP29_01150 [bacterium]|nr:MAG: hypothetical protein Ct9H90mP29_01150 [bacterium]
MGDMNLHLVQNGVKKNTQCSKAKKKLGWLDLGQWSSSSRPVAVQLSRETGVSDTTVNYTAPGLAANGMPGTSPDAAGVFARQNTAY